MEATLPRTQSGEPFVAKLLSALLICSDNTRPHRDERRIGAARDLKKLWQIDLRPKIET
jgi:hypothetical protein